MPSLLSRFRRRALSNSASASASPPVLGEIAPQIAQDHSALLIVPVQSPNPTPRKIHPDLDSLLASFEQEERPATPPGLRPRVRRHSEGSSRRDAHVRLKARLRPPEPVLEVEAAEGSSQLKGADQGEGFLNRLSHFASIDEWSTFGRHAEHPSLLLDDLNDTSNTFNNFIPVRQSSSRRAKDNSRNSIISHKNVHHSPVSSRQPTQSRASVSPSIKSIRKDRSKAPSPANTISSGKISHASARTPITPSLPNRPDGEPNSAVMSALGFDSPGTFGQPTPPRKPGPPFGMGEESPPPLPPLDHPAFATSSRTTLKFNEAPSTRHNNEKVAKPKTKRRSATIDGSQRPPRHSLEASPAIRHPLGTFLAFRHTRATSSPVQPGTGNAQTSFPRRGSSTRRRSADWSAQQAISGVNESDDLSWPAQVSREMVLLSLGASSRARSIPDLRPRSSNRGPQKKGSPRGADEASTLYFSPSPPRSPPAQVACLDSPFFLEDDPRNLSHSYDDNNHDHFTAAGAGQHHSMQSEVSISNDRSTSNGGLLPSDALSSSFNTASIPQSVDRTSVTVDAGPSSSTTQPAPDISLTSPTPGTSPKRSVSEPSGPPDATWRRPSHTRSKVKGKRKAESELDHASYGHIKEEHRTKISLPPERRVHRGSGESASSQAPSAFHRKRPRLSGSTPIHTPFQSRPASASRHGVASSSRTSVESHASRLAAVRNLSRAGSKVASTRSITEKGRPFRSSESRQSISMSHVSIPISALVSPHAPSIAPSATYHMRDPHKPKKVLSTGWALRLKNEASEEHGSPPQAWCFFIGFILFPLWWVASFWRVPKTRSVGGTDVEKAVVVDDPQVEHDAKAWRFRCRIMSVISLFTYIPFIILVAVFVHR